MMLPMALPLLIVPRIVTAWLSHRLSGRVLLTLGLSLVSAGLVWMGIEAATLDHFWILAGMLLTGIGAGLLNGETTKVGMTVIPPERAGMASGLSGTIRFTGVVVGFAALGVVLYGRIANVIRAAIPAADDVRRSAFIYDVASGKLSGEKLLLAGHPQSLALHAFGAGYQALLFAGACLTISAAALTWWLVRSSDTAPTLPTRQ